MFCVKEKKLFVCLFTCMFISSRLNVLQHLPESTTFSALYSHSLTPSPPWFLSLLKPVVFFLSSHQT